MSDRPTTNVPRWRRGELTTESRMNETVDAVNRMRRIGSDRPALAPFAPSRDNIEQLIACRIIAAIENANDATQVGDAHPIVQDYFSSYGPFLACWRYTRTEGGPLDPGLRRDTRQVIAVYTWDPAHLPAFKDSAGNQIFSGDESEPLFAAVKIGRTYRLLLGVGQEFGEIPTNICP